MRKSLNQSVSYAKNRVYLGEHEEGACDTEGSPQVEYGEDLRDKVWVLRASKLTKNKFKYSRKGNVVG